MTQFHGLHALARIGLLTAASALAVACGGTTSFGTNADKVTPGDPCSASGVIATSVDGCNTCSCDNGAWACTKKACAADGGAAPCQAGATRPAGDGCNTCSCSASGEWLCTRSACSVCTAGETKSDGCNTCSCSGGQWACTDKACPPPPPPVCKDGQTQMQDCNTCTCANGQWGCTKMACPPPPPPVCKEGDTKFDGCNTCSCSGGQWLCTLKACPPPPPIDGGAFKDGGTVVDASPPAKGCGARLGDTCSATEYCAYTEGQLCGAADASSTCQPRPQVCTAIYAPVCGCDGKDYSSDCTAAGAGTGVLHAGTCP